MQNTIKYRVPRIFESSQKVQREKPLDRDTNSANPFQSSKNDKINHLRDYSNMVVSNDHVIYMTMTIKPHCKLCPYNLLMLIISKKNIVTSFSLK